MLDTSWILADRVSYLLKTRYAQLTAKDRPFDLAFTDAMNDFGIGGEARGELKSEIGKLLAARPRKVRTKKFLRTQKFTPQFSFGIVKASRSEVILKSPTGGEEFVFRRNSDGKVVNTSFTGRGSTHVLLTRALELAEKLFADKDYEAVQYGRVRILEEDVNHLLVIIADKFEVYISRGLRRGGVAATVTRSGERLPQKGVPADLLREAKAIAIQCFKGSGSLALPFD